ncbi:hypothetical protein METBIDRAFT_43510 [Metschnikowia bicuspidata var. bicuspidata NRRL YB-4993]|uniref:Protein HRI1 n=1 Tax=Metschnikowia bicuspidata var. bicuspidata NRRL YB-4993 TaxID=869754 RepID=A0A1A0H957_9ASCO|nr:hypothetical protein METBIDRAFT_43510 [Metschnikowia bicuspidata var. bicuspidata NRRL YB-4993]OBA20417.1 hypothetical protein METBIDRAFT_43510 [Metschnikowia bicuspidata var. bicuspidata NRRL YB-4993]
MVLSTRVSLQWLPDEPQECTNTMVFTSLKDHFVDVRIYKDQYPYRQSGDTPEKFENVFQWVIVGDEEEIEGTNQIQFNHTVNSQEIMKSLVSGKPLSECRSAPDIGSFWAIEGTEDRKETGSMAHPDTGIKTEYVEIWRSLNPNASSVKREVREGYDVTGLATQDAPGPVMTFDLKADGFIGRIIRLGNWVQGVIYEENERRFPISVMRSFWDADSGVWQELVGYGKHEFPEIYKSEGTCRLPGSWELVE